MQSLFMEQELIKRVAQIALRNDGRITLDQMRAAGADRFWVARQSKKGWITRGRRGNYVLGPHHLVTRRGSAVDGGGPGSMMLGSHGLHAWGLIKRIDPNEPIVVWSPTHRRNGSGVRYSRSAWVQQCDARTLGNLRIGSRAACIASAAGRYESVDLVGMIKEACFWEPSAAAELHGLLDRNGRSFRGADRIRCALDWYLHGHCGFDSATEKWVVSFLRRIGAPMPVINAWVQLSDEPMRVDMYWREAGLVGEVNPVGHTRPWVRTTDLGRIARVERDQLRTISIDMTLPIRERERRLREAAMLACQPRVGPDVPIVVPPAALLSLNGASRW